MKLRLKSAIKCANNQFDFYDNTQVLFRIGNNLCIKQLDRKQYQFIPLNNQMDHLLSFCTSPGSKAVFTIQKHQGNYSVCSYPVAKGSIKSIKMPDIGLLQYQRQIEKFYLLKDYFDLTIAYGAFCTNSESIVFLVDFGPSKVIATGFTTLFEDIKVMQKQTYTLSICGKGFIRQLKPSNGKWEVEDKNIKRLHNENYILHDWIGLNKVVACTKTDLFVIEDTELKQTLKLNCASIDHFIVFPRGLFIVSDGTHINIFSQNNEDNLFYSHGYRDLNTLFQQPIQKMVLNVHQDSLLIKSQRSQFFQWKTDLMGERNQQDRFFFITHQSVLSKNKQVSVSIAINKNYALIVQHHIVKVWDLIKNSSLISIQMKDQYDKPKKIYANAINPDSNSIILGFSDKVRLYNILLWQLKPYAQFSIKKCRLIEFSNSGHLAACHSGSGSNSMVTIINILTEKQLCTFKFVSSVKHMTWDQFDQQLIVSTQKNKVISLKLSTRLKQWQLQLPQQINHMQFDYKSNKIIVSTKTMIYVMKNQKQYEKIPSKISDFDSAIPVNGQYILCNTKGSVFLSNNIQTLPHTQVKLFTNQTFKFLYSTNFSIAYNDFGEVVLLDYFKNIESKNNESQLVLVEKNQIIKFFQQVKILQSNFDTLNQTSATKIQEERKKYQQALHIQTNNFKKQILFIQKKYQTLQSQKIKQQKQHDKVFDTVQNGQLKNVYELQKMYDKKFAAEKDKYLSLQQQSLEYKMKNQKQFKLLKQQYEKQIEDTRKQYQNKLQSQLEKQDIKKNRQFDNKKKLEAKIINLEEENQLVLNQLQNNKDNKIRSLHQKIIEMEREYVTSIVNQHNLKQDLQQMKIQYDDNKQNLAKSQRKVIQYLNRVHALETQIEKKNNMIQERNNVIEQQGEQIAGLEKAKYVLNFRTTEIRKEVEPKQLQIEKLKKELFKVDEQFKQQTKKTFQLKQKLQKFEKMVQNTKKESLRFREELKVKDKVHDQLCSQIFNMVNQLDTKQWDQNIVKIYRNYVRQQKHGRGKKKQDETAQQINKRLIHVEKTLIQVTTGNDKAIKGRQKDVIRKMKQNSDLVFDLNNMRKKENQLENEIKQKNNQISRLKRQINQYNKSTRACSTAGTGVTRRNKVSRDKKLINNETFDLSIKRTSDYLVPEKRNRILSANRTVMWREQNKRQKSKVITDLARQLQTAKNTIRRQDRMIEQLNQRLLGLPQDILS